MDNLGIGLLLMVVGMVTVFIILLIVIYLSKILISLVNKFAPNEELLKSLHNVLLPTMNRLQLSKQL